MMPPNTPRSDVARLIQELLQANETLPARIARAIQLAPGSSASARLLPDRPAAADRFRGMEKLFDALGAVHPLFQLPSLGLRTGRRAIDGLSLILGNGGHSLSSAVLPRQSATNVDQSEREDAKQAPAVSPPQEYPVNRKATVLGPLARGRAKELANVEAEIERMRKLKERNHEKLAELLDNPSSLSKRKYNAELRARQAAVLKSNDYLADAEGRRAQVVENEFASRGQPLPARAAKTRLQGGRLVPAGGTMLADSAEFDSFVPGSLTRLEGMIEKLNTSITELSRSESRRRDPTEEPEGPPDEDERNVGEHPRQKDNGAKAIETAVKEFVKPPKPTGAFRPEPETESTGGDAGGLIAKLIGALL